MSDVINFADPVRPPTLDELVRLEEWLLEQPQIDLPIEHHFANGTYARTMNVPAGALIMGAMHRFDHICVISQGSIRVGCVDGVQTYHAGDVIVSKAGVKRALFAITDCRWTNLHKCETTDIDRVWDELTVPKEEVYSKLNTGQCLLVEGE